MSDKRYRVEPDEADEECARLHAEFSAGLAVNEPYRLAWEEMSVLIHVNSGMTPVEVDMIARKHGIREE
jgi:hypothetical protein